MDANNAGHEPMKASVRKPANAVPLTPRRPPATSQPSIPAARQKVLWKNFSQTVAVLMRDTRLKNMKISDMESLVLPPVLLGQCKIAQAKVGPQGNQPDSISVAPVAVALWARVSPAIDKKLMENLDKQVDFKPADWASGDIIWLTLVGGEKRFINELLKVMVEKDFKGQKVKIRAQGADGKTTVKLLGNPA